MYRELQHYQSLQKSRSIESLFQKLRNDTSLNRFTTYKTFTLKSDKRNNK